ncbi:MAG: zinc-ribbon domain-containing protein [Chloroflexales bacterium]|nr:zinc-ribbon domain-containing protein [Chloroflexales bacterium]
MEQRIYSGPIEPRQLASALLDEWDQGATIAQALDAEGGVIIQIGQREGGWFGEEPRQALTLGIEAITDGVRVTLGQQQWYRQGGQIMVGGLIGFFPFFFAWPLGDFFRGPDAPLDAGLPGQIWQSVERYAAQAGAATGPTRRLETFPCPACGVANPQGAARCSACGAALERPACPTCGTANPPGARFCIHCGTQLRPDAHALGEA